MQCVTTNLTVKLICILVAIPGKGEDKLKEKSRKCFDYINFGKLPNQKLHIKITFFVLLNNAPYLHVYGFK